MGVKVNNYVSLSCRYANYGEDGYFINQCIIGMMIYDELKLQKLEEFVNEASITITEEDIIDFLDKKMDEEQPGLRTMLEEEMKSSNSTVITFISDAEENQRKMDASNKKMKDMATCSRYYFYPYSLQYFKTYVSRLKEKLASLFSVLHDIEMRGFEEVSEESKQRFDDLDFHFNLYDDIYFKDAERLANAIIYNVKDLREKVQIGNNPETYLDFKEHYGFFLKDGIMENEIYPSTKIQIKDRYCAHKPEFIALSEAQQTEVQRIESECHKKWLNRVQNPISQEKGPVLHMVKKENNE